MENTSSIGTGLSTSVALCAPLLQAAHNATAASRLLQLMKRVDEKVADLMAADALKEGKGRDQGSESRSSSINSGLKRLAMASQTYWWLVVGGGGLVHIMFPIPPIPIHCPS